ncbi:MAG: DUF4335 domain-containing protein [Spirulinaceae cyanobacterium]
MLTLERRFHFASCSLIVRARRSLLSLWQPAAGRRSLRWELRFSPLTAEAQAIVLKGNASQLQQLHQVVNHYLTTTFLAQPSSNVPLFAPVAKVFKPQQMAPTLLLRGLLSHELVCGPLASNQPQLLLGATQLADLALALDTYAQAQASQTLWAQPSRQRPWQPIALGSMALAILAVLGSLYWQRSRAPVFSSAPATEDTMIANNPEVVPPPPLPAPTPLETPTLPGDLAQLGELKPPSGVNIPNRPLPGQSNATLRPPAAGGRSNGEQASTSTATTESAAPADPTATTVPAPQVPPLPPLQANADPDLLPDAVAESAIATMEPNSADAPIAFAPEQADAAARGANQAAPPTSLPQVREVQQYFAQRAPLGPLPEAGVRYRLFLGADGSLMRLRPLDAAAREALDSLTMPRLGVPFVSPLVGHRQAEIHLHIQPGGRVSTRLEKVQ